jgi:hypothetical protein
MKTVIEMAEEVGAYIAELPLENAVLFEVDILSERSAKLEAFAALVTEQANARANTSWALMCKKMVADEREACAKLCESAREAIWEYHDEPLKAAACNTCTNIAAAIRARGQA